MGMLCPHPAHPFSSFPPPLPFSPTSGLASKSVELHFKKHIGKKNLKHVIVSYVRKTLVFFRDAF